MSGDLVAEFLLVFATIFAFEIVDRTNFGVITLATRHHHGEVWVGAALAFLVSTTIAIAIGWLVVSYLLPYVVYVRVVGGVVLVLFGAKTILEKTPEGSSPRAEKVPEKLPRSQVVMASFSLILLLEMGDNTQVLTILFATQTSLAIVFVAACLALCCVAGIGAFAGRFLKDRVPAEQLERALGAILIVVGLFTIAWAAGLIPLPFF